MYVPAYTYKLQWATKAVETLLGNDAFRYLSIGSILSASCVNSLIPPPIQCCVGAVVCAVQEIEKSTLSWGEGGKCDQDAQKFNFITKCLNTFVAHCSFLQVWHAYERNIWHHRCPNSYSYITVYMHCLNIFHGL